MPRDPRTVLSSFTSSQLCGTIAVMLGHLTRDQLDTCLREQALADPRQRKPLGRLLVERGWLTEADLARVLDVQDMSSRRRGEALLGRIGVANGLLTEGALQECLEEQRQDPNAPLGEILVRRGRLRPADLESLLAAQKRVLAGEARPVAEAPANAYDVSGSSEILIGRDPGNDIVLEDLDVSRRHCRIVREAGRVFLEDCGSIGGVWFRGSLVEGRVELAAGDTFLVGRTALTWEEEAAGPAAAAAPRGGRTSRVRLRRRRHSSPVPAAVGVAAACLLAFVAFVLLKKDAPRRTETAQAPDAVTSATAVVPAAKSASPAPAARPVVEKPIAPAPVDPPKAPSQPTAEPQRAPDEKPVQPATAPVEPKPDALPAAPGVATAEPAAGPADAGTIADDARRETQAELSPEMLGILEGLKRALTMAQRESLYDRMTKVDPDGPRVLREVLLERRRVLMGKLQKTPHLRALARLERAKLELFERRVDALQAIGDAERYTKDRGQGEVDRLVGEVRKAYTRKDAPPPLRVTGEASGWLEEIEALQKRLAGMADVPRLPSWVAALALARKAPLSFTDCPLAFEDPGRREANAEVEAHNQRMMSKLAREEWSYVQELNAYRVMMGRRALKLSLELCAAARSHAEEMARKGFFDHFSPTPGRKSPTDRARAHGYPSRVVGENISEEAQNGRKEFDGLYHSAPHHRNMLFSKFTHVGAAWALGRWTINLGEPSDEYQETK